MTPTKIIINAGLARCGTTATYDVFRKLPGFATPRGVKELKFFLQGEDPAAYLAHFSPQPGDALFEASPPYMHNGVETFEAILRKLLALRDAGLDVHLLVHVRNLLKRAFSHYWHDINGHFAIFGRAWRVKTVDDPRRFQLLYKNSFLSELTSEQRRDHFMPHVGEMLHRAVELLGQDRVRVVHTQGLDAGITAFLREFLGRPDMPGVTVPRLGAVAAPLYLYGGKTGQSFTLWDEDRTQVSIPAHTCLLFARRHQEVLSGTDHDLAEITRASERWTRAFDTSVLPQSFRAYLDAQAAQLATLPEACFLAGQRDAILADLAEVPDHLSIRTAEPAPATVRALLAKAKPVEAADDGKVMRGRDNRLFLHHDMNSVMAQHTGRLVLSESDLAAWVSLLERRTAICQARGLPYAMMFAPDPHAIYKEAIPELDGLDVRRPVLNILERYQGGNLYYPLEAMRAARARGEVCHETDSHWSAWGALVGLRVLLAGMGLGVPVLGDDDVRLFDRMLVGDLGSKFDPPVAGRTTQVQIKTPQSEKIWSNTVSNRGHMTWWRSRRRDLPRALLLTDSNGWRFQVVMAESFSDLFVVHSPQLDIEAIERFGPDVVVSLQAERFAYKVPEDATGPSALEHARAKKPDACYPDFAAPPHKAGR